MFWKFQVMGQSSSKSSSKLASDPNLDYRLKQGSDQVLATATSTSTNRTHDNPNNDTPIKNYLLNEKSLRDWCKGFNKEFPDTQLSKILDDERLLAPFLTDIFYREVELTDSMQTLFRGNCLASKIMSHCFRTFGSRYLKDLLEPHIVRLLEVEKKANHDSAISSPARLWRTSSNDTSNAQNFENTAQLISKRLELTAKESATSFDNNNSPMTQNLARQKRKQLSQDETTSKTPISRTKSAISYEIDSTRLDEDDDIDINQKNLLKLTNEILNSILSSAPNFPPQLNLMCICLREVLDKKYPDTDDSLKAVGTVIFLRFINPAIVSPYEAGVIDKQPKQKTMRGLMLVSKILQNIANNVEFSKEEHMLPFNDFVRGQFEPIRLWVSEISSDRHQQQRQDQ